jgi:hypothetical protein
MFLSSHILRTLLQLHVFCSHYPLTVFFKVGSLIIFIFYLDGGQIQSVDISKCDVGRTCITCLQCRILKFSYIFQLRFFLLQQLYNDHIEGQYLF